MLCVFTTNEVFLLLLEKQYSLVYLCNINDNEACLNYRKLKLKDYCCFNFSVPVSCYFECYCAPISPELAECHHAVLTLVGLACLPRFFSSAHLHSICKGLSHLFLASHSPSISLSYLSLSSPYLKVFYSWPI